MQHLHDNDDTEMNMKLSETPKLRMDNQAGLESLGQPCFRKNSRHMAIKWYFVKEAVITGEIKAEIVQSNQNTSDVFTKPVSTELFRRFKRTILNMQPDG